MTEFESKELEDVLMPRAALVEKHRRKGLLFGIAGVATTVVTALLTLVSNEPEVPFFWGIIGGAVFFLLGIRQYGISEKHLEFLKGARDGLNAFQANIDTLIKNQPTETPRKIKIKHE